MTIEDLQAENRLLKIRNSMLTEQLEVIHRRYAHLPLEDHDAISRLADLIDALNHYIPMLIKENRRYRNRLDWKERQMIREEVL